MSSGDLPSLFSLSVFGWPLSLFLSIRGRFHPHDMYYTSVRQMASFTHCGNGHGIKRDTFKEIYYKGKNPLVVQWADLWSSCHCLATASPKSLFSPPPRTKPQMGRDLKGGNNALFPFFSWELPVRSDILEERDLKQCPDLETVPYAHDRMTVPVKV